MVTRGIHPDTKAALSARFFHPITMVYLDWPGGAVRLHSSVGELTFGGYTWSGVGRLGSVLVPSETKGAGRSDMKLRIIGLPAEIERWLQDDIRFRRAELWFGVTTERSGTTFIGEPWIQFTGYMDALVENIKLEGGGVARGLTLSVADGPSQRLTTSVFHTDEDQRLAHPTDTAGRLVLNTEPRARDLRWPE